MSRRSAADETGGPNKKQRTSAVSAAVNHAKPDSVFLRVSHQQPISALLIFAILDMPDLLNVVRSCKAFAQLAQMAPPRNSLYTRFRFHAQQVTDLIPLAQTHWVHHYVSYLSVSCVTRASVRRQRYGGVIEGVDHARIPQPEDFMKLVSRCHNVKRVSFALSVRLANPRAQIHQAFTAVALSLECISVLFIGPMHGGRFDDVVALLEHVALLRKLRCFQLMVSPMITKKHAADFNLDNLQKLENLQAVHLDWAEPDLSNMQRHIDALLKCVRLEAVAFPLCGDGIAVRRDKDPVTASLTTALQRWKEGNGQGQELSNVAAQASAAASAASSRPPKSHPLAYMQMENLVMSEDFFHTLLDVFPGTEALLPSCWNIPLSLDLSEIGRFKSLNCLHIKEQAALDAGPLLRRFFPHLKLLPRLQLISIRLARLSQLDVATIIENCAALRLLCFHTVIFETTTALAPLEQSQVTHLALDKCYFSLAAVQAPAANPIKISYMPRIASLTELSISGPCSITKQSLQRHRYPKLKKCYFGDEEEDKYDADQIPDSFWDFQGRSIGFVRLIAPDIDNL